MIHSINQDQEKFFKYFTQIHLQIIDTELDVMSSPCHKCYHCNRNKTIYFFGRGKVKRRIKCDSNICKLLPSIGYIRPKDYIRNRQCSFL